MQVMEESCRQRAALVWLATASLMGVLACAGPQPSAPERPGGARVSRATEGVREDPVVEAHLAAIDAAQAREGAPRFVEEVEVRVEDDYIDNDHRISLLARVPMTRISELRAQREVYAAETEIAISELEQASLERRAELCFPGMETLAAEERRRIYADYFALRQELLEWNEEWRRAGTVNELRSARFELETRIKLASWAPEPAPPLEEIVVSLPPVAAQEGALVRTPELVRASVLRHSPSVTVRRAMADRYRALAARSRARSEPWIKFFDLGYEHRTDGSDNGVSAQLSFEIPLGGERSQAGRYAALVRKEDAAARGVVADQMSRTQRALDHLHDYESHTRRWLDLLRLADEAEAIAQRWWRGRLAKPSDVAALLDQAFSARNVVLDARERAGEAYCTVLAMSGLPVEAWPREGVATGYELRPANAIASEESDRPAIP